MRVCWAGVLGLALVAGSPTPAQTLSDDYFLNRGGACYLRDYSAGHLQSHPVQQVRRMALSATGLDGGALVLSLTVWVRGLTLPDKMQSYCTDFEGGLQCAIEGDKGFYTLAPARDGALMLRPSNEGITLETVAGFIALRGNSGDDRAFLLPVAPAEFCP